MSDRDSTGAGDEETALGRRDVLKKGAMAGAVIWSAPVVIGSVGSPAAAFTPLCEPCAGCPEGFEEYLVVGTKIGESDGSSASDWQFSISNGASIPPGCAPCGYRLPQGDGSDPVVDFNVTPTGFIITVSCPEAPGGEEDGGTGGGTVCFNSYSAAGGAGCLACGELSPDCDEPSNVLEIDVDKSAIDAIYITVCADCTPTGEEEG